MEPTNRAVHEPRKKTRHPWFPQGLGRLNESQREAVSAAVQRTLTVIQGPPGTGRSVDGSVDVRSVRSGVGSLGWFVGWWVGGSVGRVFLSAFWGGGGLVWHSPVGKGAVELGASKLAKG